MITFLTLINYSFAYIAIVRELWNCCCLAKRVPNSRTVYLWIIYPRSQIWPVSWSNIPSLNRESEGLIFCLCYQWYLFLFECSVESPCRVLKWMASVLKEFPSMPQWHLLTHLIPEAHHIQTTLPQVIDEFIDMECIYYPSHSRRRSSL